MVNADTGNGGEQGTVLGEIERLTSGLSSEELRLIDHPFYGHGVVTMVSDVVVGRRFWSGKVWVNQTVLEFTDIISLSRDGLEQVKVMDANAVPFSIQVAFADYSETEYRPHPFSSVTMYLDSFGHIVAALPVMSRPYADPQVERAFDTRMLEWGIEMRRSGSGQNAVAGLCTTGDWASRISSSLLDLA